MTVARFRISCMNMVKSWPEQNRAIQRPRALTEWFLHVLFLRTIMQNILPFFLKKINLSRLYPQTDRWIEKTSILVFFTSTKEPISLVSKTRFIAKKKIILIATELFGK